MEPRALREAVLQKPVRVGRYDVVSALGRGGMGDVYEAIDVETGGRVALKTLGARELAPDRLLLFKNEFRSVADLAHRNLVPLYELGCHDGLWFVTMELVRGVDLVDRLTRTYEGDTEPRRRSLPTPRTQATRAERPHARGQETSSTEIAIPIVREPTPYCDLALFTSTIAQVLDALEYLHQHGVVHQDLKPNNLIVQDDGTVRILDFGLAQRIGASVRLSGDDQRIGTPEYMAPELWFDGAATPASDLFALGCMMFELLTGNVPSEDGFLRARRPPSVAELVDGVPARVVEVCDRLLALAPDDRPTIAEVREALGVEPPTAPALRPSPGLVGRARERELLRLALERVSGGGSVVALVEGGSGVGKSALVRSCFRDEPLSDGVVALHGRCYERESVPFKAFDGMIDEVAIRLSGFDDDAYAELLPPYFDELTKVFPVLASGRERAAQDVSGVFPMELRRRVLEALYQLFVGLAAHVTLALDIDDLQWADAESLALLEKLVHGAPPGLLVVLSLRPEESAERADVSSLLRDVRSLPAERVASIALGPLEPADAEALARSSLRSLELPDDLAPAIARESRGIPFFLEELAQSAAARTGGTDADVRLDHALDARARDLPAPARALVEVLAVANNPIPRAVACVAAELEGDVSSVLALLQRGRFMRNAGVHADDRLGIYHDRMREAVIARLSEERTAAIHLALGRAHASTLGDAPAGAPLFDAVRHLGAASELLSDVAERARAAELHLLAGRQARAAASFALALRFFEAGIALSPADAWERDHETCLALHVGAAEAAYLTANWPVMDRRVADVKAHARSPLELLPVWAVQIDALSGRQEFAAAIDVGIEALERLGERVPREPDEATVGAAFGRALDGLTRLGPEGLAAMPDATDEVVLGAMRIRVRLCPVAFFANQSLLALMACELVSASVEHGLSTATPNALALFGLIMNTAGMYRVSHAWGELAIRLIDRWDDRSLEAATRHVVYDFVCPWIAPLRTITPRSREVFEIGFRSGDFEYAGYAAHVWTYMELATGSPLGPLRDEALSLGRRMREYGHLNALHIHAPFEQLLISLADGKEAPWRLDGVGYSEDEALAKVEEVRSRGSICVHHVAIGITRFFFGRFREASEHLEIAREYLDGAPSCWLIPHCHQFAVLAGTAIFRELAPAERDALRPRIDASVAAMRAYAEQGDANFAHRVALLDGAVLGIEAGVDAALARTREALAASERGGWTMEEALAHDVLARQLTRAGRPEEARTSAASALDAYSRWGAAGVVRYRAAG